MVNRRRWTSKEENDLKMFTESNLGVKEIATKLQKTPRAVMVKCQRLGLQLQVNGYVDTSIAIPKELPSIEESTKILAGALRASVKPGLNKVDVQRLQVVANICKMYKDSVVDFARYRDVECKLEEMEKQNAQLQQMLKEIQERTPSVSPQPVPG